MMVSKGQLTRESILRAGLASASQFGLEALSIGALARSIGLSKSGLFAHFGSKEELQREILLEAASRFVQRVVVPAIQRPRGEPRVRGLFENWLSWVDATEEAPGGCLFASSSMEFDDRPGSVRDTISAQVEASRGTLARAARIAVEEGQFREDLDPEQFAFELHSLILGYHLASRLFRRPQAQTRACRAFESLLRTARRP